MDAAPNSCDERRQNPYAPADFSGRVGGPPIRGSAAISASARCESSQEDRGERAQSPIHCDRARRRLPLYRRELKVPARLSWLIWPLVLALATVSLLSVRI